MEIGPKISGEDVIEKLKDDGDFDKLRLKIIRKLKDNEELRNNIIAIVKQSAALNRAGAENVKPRQLSDAIYDEVGEEIMSKVSDNLWEIIRSADGMKNEITETVQSVYNKLANPKAEENAEASTQHTIPVRKEVNNGSMKASTSQFDHSEADPIEPPGFSFAGNHTNNGKQHVEELQFPKCHEGRHNNDSRNVEGHHPNNVFDADDVDLPPGFVSNRKHNQMCKDAGSDEDPDVPPGFG
ncbi:uncharacterized protein LOC120089960 [Benincasa hispida]|uniref:uncharacterized protein LOC120089960 n=1 Tax=Benincasa hispida TaxID=102211 RepID=UPI0018FFD554|nr:uncharacterized protein LOC120089960 [Benincasa hispida]